MNTHENKLHNVYTVNGAKYGNLQVCMIVCPGRALKNLQFHLNMVRIS